MFEVFPFLDDLNELHLESLGDSVIRRVVLSKNFFEKPVIREITSVPQALPEIVVKI
jgi:hypothetical protein